jgi:L-iditol 2-dehydrogenase
LCTTWPRPGTAGAFTELLTVSKALSEAAMLVMEDDMDEKVMSLAEPFACILNSMGKSQVKPGQTALVIGAGPMGLLHIEGLKMAGASEILVSEFNETRGKIAESMGAKVINPGKTPDVKAEIKKLLNGEALDQVFVCVGIPAVVEDAMLLVDKGGTVNIFGGLKSGCTITIDPNIIHYDEVKLVGTFGFSTENFMTSAKMLAEGKVDMSQMITHVFPLADAEKAFELGAHPTDDVVKILIEMA